MYVLRERESVRIKANGSLFSLKKKNVSILYVMYYVKIAPSTQIALKQSELIH